MSKTLELPDGTIVTDIRSSATTEEIETFLVGQGIVPPTDFEQFLYEVNTPARQKALQAIEEIEVDPQTSADYITPALELALGIPAATVGTALGASGGFAVGGPPGAFVGSTTLGTLFSSSAVGAANIIGETVESLVEGRKVDPAASFEQAKDAAQTDAIMSAGLGIVFGAGGKIYRKGKELVGGKKGLPDEDIEIIKELQEELKQIDSTLQPQMVEPKRTATEIIGSFAKVSQVTKRTVENLFESYNKYMGNQTQQLVSMFKGGTPREQGEVLQSLINQVDTALDEIVAPVYKQIAESGKGVAVQARDRARQSALEFKHKFKGDPKYNKKTKEWVETYPSLTGKAAAQVKELENLPTNLNFQEAHERLSSVKRRLHAARTASTKDPDYIESLALTRDALQDSMQEAAEKLNPALKKQYDEVTDYYAKGQKVVGDTFLEKAMDVLDPSEIGAMLTKPGFTVGIDQINTLKKLAAQYAKDLPKDSEVGVKLAKQLRTTDPIEGIRKGFLEEALKFEGRGGAKSVEQLQKKLNDPKFRATFKHLFAGTPVEKKVDKLIKKLEILERGASGGAGFQLTVAGAEQQAAKNIATEPLSITKQIINFLPGLLARKSLKASEIDKTINLIDAATAAQKQGVTLGKNYEDVLRNTMLGVKVGVGLGALL